MGFRVSRAKTASPWMTNPMRVLRFGLRNLEPEAKLLMASIMIPIDCLSDSADRTSVNRASWVRSNLGPSYLGKMYVA